MKPGGKIIMKGGVENNEGGVTAAFFIDFGSLLGALGIVFVAEPPRLPFWN